MMLLEFKNYIWERISILKLSIKYSIDLDTVSIFNKWGDLLSTLAYTASYVLFINILFANTKDFGGYNKNEILFLTFITQAYFFTYSLWTGPNLDLLLSDIKTGNLDQVLSKPIPTLFYITFRKLNIIDTLRDFIPPALVMVFSINWLNLNITFVSLIAGIFIFICGQIAINGYNFLLLFPSFVIGEAENLRALGSTFDDLNKIPYEGQIDFVKKLFTSLLPILLGGVLATSVLLGKSDPIQAILVSLITAGVFLFLKSFFWKKALRAYSSASS